MFVSVRIGWKLARIKIFLHLTARNQPLCGNGRIEAWLHATGATAALTRPARRRRTAPTTTLPAAFSPVRICSLPSLSYPLLSLPQTLALDLAFDALLSRCAACLGSSPFFPRCGGQQPRKERKGSSDVDLFLDWCGVDFVRARCISRLAVACGRARVRMFQCLGAVAAAFVCFNVCFVAVVSRP